ncbi:MAG: S-adenosylhomocysteine deaminase, partial [Aquifex sp.]
MKECDILIKNALIPGKEGEWDIAVKEGKIEKIGKNLTVKAKYTINAKGKVVFPSFANMHTHISMTLF